MSQPNTIGTQGGERTEYVPSDKPWTAEEIQERKKTNGEQKDLDKVPMTPAANQSLKSLVLPSDLFWAIFNMASYLATKAGKLCQLTLAEVTATIDEVKRLADLMVDPDCAEYACDSPKCRRWVNRETNKVGRVITPRTHNLVYFDKKTGKFVQKSHTGEGPRKGELIRVGSFVVIPEVVKAVGEGGVASFNPTGHKVMKGFCQECLAEFVKATRGERGANGKFERPPVQKLTYARAQEIVSTLASRKAEYETRVSEDEAENSALLGAYVENYRPRDKRGGQGGFRGNRAGNSGRFKGY